MTRLDGIALLFIALLAATGCATADPNAGKHALEGEVWHWVGLRGAETLVVAEPARYTLEFTPDSHYLVRADCNTGSGSYTLEGDRLRFGLGILTQAACEARSEDLRFLTRFRNVERFARSGDALVLYLEDGAGTMEFTARGR